MEPGTKHLIVNADDFGQSPGVNWGIVEAHEHGIVTSASLMVCWPASPEAARYAREHSRLSLGLHADLGEWTYQRGRWIPVYERVSLQDVEAVRRDAALQLEMFRRLVGRDPTHIDSHQHVHWQEPVRSVLMGMARQLGVPLRSFSARIRYCGNFYGQTADGQPIPDAINVRGLLRSLRTLMPGVTELGCHPGEGNDLKTMYRTERALEVKALCDPEVRAALLPLGIELRSFSDAGIG